MVIGSTPTLVDKVIKSEEKNILQLLRWYPDCKYRIRINYNISRKR